MHHISSIYGRQKQSLESSVTIPVEGKPARNNRKQTKRELLSSCIAKSDCNQQAPCEYAYLIGFMRQAEDMQDVSWSKRTRTSRDPIYNRPLPGCPRCLSQLLCTLILHRGYHLFHRWSTLSLDADEYQHRMGYLVSHVQQSPFSLSRL